MKTTILTKLAILAVAASPMLATATADAQVVNVRTDRIVGSLVRPVYVTQAPGDPTRLYIVLKAGSIRIFDLTTNTLLATPFVTVPVTGGTTTSDERGLLGLAFHPDYAKNGQFYVYYTGSNTNVLARYTRSADNPLVANPTVQVMMSWSDPFSNHNGGWIDFGPDGNLYIGVGDGGSGNDPNNAGQNINTKLGKIHRITPTVGGASPFYTIPASNPFVGVSGDDTIWAYGLRNPWRCSFDRETGDLWIADVGQSAIEEINFQAANAAGGINYGWRCMEGNNCTGLTGCTCNAASLVRPIRTYGHVSGTSGGFSITGGYVYRGCRMPELRGTYFYADYVSNNVWSFRYNASTDTQSEFTLRNSQITPSLDGFTVNQIVSFGEDLNGEMYIVDQGSGSDGQIFKIVPTDGDGVCQPPCAPADLDCNGVVNASDLTILLGNWGQAGVGDLDGNGVVNGSDLTQLLSAWG